MSQSSGNKSVYGAFAIPYDLFMFKPATSYYNSCIQKSENG